MDEAPLHFQIGRRINYLRRIAHVELNARLAPLNASAAMYSVLMRLAQDTNVPQSELATDAALDPAGISRLVNRMAKDGLLCITEDPSDRRVRRVALTAKGAKLERSLAPVVQDTVQRIFAGLDEGEMRQLLALLEKSHTPEAEGATQSG